MIIAQKTETAEFDSMPRSAIATGLVDYELKPEEMVGQLLTYTSQLFGKLPRPVVGPEPAVDGSLRKIFALLRSQTSHDFSQYKPSTIYRRIERRMAVHQIEAIENYVKYLQQSPAEIEALFRDLLIGVTNFFRDPEAFQALETHVIPQLMAARSPINSTAKEVLRIWICGCSTGEEAYSIAILLREQMEINGGISRFRSLPPISIVERLQQRGPDFFQTELRRTSHRSGCRGSFSPNPTAAAIEYKRAFERCWCSRSTTSTKIPRFRSLT